MSPQLFIEILVFDLVLSVYIII